MLGVVVELAGDAEPVGLVAGLEVGVHAVHGAEVGHVEPPPVALEAVAKGGEAAVVVEPLREIGDDLFAGALAEEIFELGPGFGLRFLDEGEGFAGEEGRVPVKLAVRDDLVAVVEEVIFEDGFERGLVGLGVGHDWLRWLDLRRMV